MKEVQGFSTAHPIACIINANPFFYVSQKKSQETNLLVEALECYFCLAHFPLM